MSKRSNYLKVVSFTIVILASMLGEPIPFTVQAAAPDGQEDICTSPAVIFCDNFEARSLGGGTTLSEQFYKSTWNPSSASDMTVVNNTINGGAKALEFLYPESTDGIGYMEIAFAAQQSDLYFRWYQKFSSNFQFSLIATKGAETLINHSPGQSMYFWWNNWGDGGISHLAQNADHDFEANVNGGTWFPAMNQWYCLEARFKYNSGASDGVLQSWVNGTLRWDYSNVALDSPGTLMKGMLLSGYWNNSTSQQGNPAGVSHPTMYRWFDNFVISTQRIGCLGSAPTPAPPPATPSGLTVE